MLPFLDTSIRSRLRRKTQCPKPISWQRRRGLTISALSQAPRTRLQTSWSDSSKVFKHSPGFRRWQCWAVKVYASRHITTFLGKRKTLDASRVPLFYRRFDVNLLESWATDLLRASGRFRSATGTDRYMSGYSSVLSWQLHGTSI